MKLYRQVKVSKRLPNKTRTYKCVFKGDARTLRDYPYEIGRSNSHFKKNVNWWLEEIEITEEEIYKILYDNMIDYKFTSIGDSVDFKLWKSAKEILKLFKEDKK